MILGMALFLLLPLLLGGTDHAPTAWEGCVAAGKPVPTIQDDAAEGVALGGDGRIIINPGRMRNYSAPLQKFIYWHECSHVVLEHAQPSLANEMAADCVGFRFLETNSSLSVEEIVTIVREMSLLPGDWAHLPGPARVDHLIKCAFDP